MLTECVLTCGQLEYLVVYFAHVCFSFAVLLVIICCWFDLVLNWLLFDV